MSGRYLDKCSGYVLTSLDGLVPDKNIQFIESTTYNALVLSL